MARSVSPSISVSRRGSVRGEADCTVVWVRGDHDIATTNALAVALARAARLDHVPLVVDLRAVTFMDASIIGALVGSRKRLRSRALTLEVRAPSPAALRVIELCGLANLVHREPRPRPMPVALSSWVDVLPVRTGAEVKARQPVEVDGGGP